MTAELAVATQFAVGLVFLYSGALKALHPIEFFRGLHEYGIERTTFAAPLGTVLIFSEIAIGLAHLTGWMIEWAALSGAALMAAFILVVSIMLTKGVVARWLCFGAAEDELVSMRTVLRLVLLLLAELLIGGFWLADIGSPALAQSSGVSMLSALVNAVSLLLVASWIVWIPELAPALRSFVRRPAERQAADQ